jgi:hypothetical protein
MGHLTGSGVPAPMQADIAPITAEAGPESVVSAAVYFSSRVILDGCPGGRPNTPLTTRVTYKIVCDYCARARRATAREPPVCGGRDPRVRPSVQAGDRGEPPAPRPRRRRGPVAPDLRDPLRREYSPGRNGTRTSRRTSSMPGGPARRSSRGRPRAWRHGSGRGSGRCRRSRPRPQATARRWTRSASSWRTRASWTRRASCRRDSSERDTRSGAGTTASDSR